MIFERALAFGAGEWARDRTVGLKLAGCTLYIQGARRSRSLGSSWVQMLACCKHNTCNAHAIGTCTPPARSLPR